MTWTSALIAVPLVCYLCAAVAYGIQKNWPMTIVYSGYAWAQGGLWLLDKVMTK